MNFLYLLLTSAIPVVKVCLLSLVGVALAHLVRLLQQPHCQGFGLHA